MMPIPIEMFLHGTNVSEGFQSFDNFELHG